MFFLLKTFLIKNTYIFTSTNNFIQNDNYIQPDLKNCENILKDYFNLDYLNITVNYLNYEIYKGIIIYNIDYSIIVLLNDITICSKENIYYNESLKEILECYETCKSCNGIEINNWISCYNNRILTSRNTCEDVYEECGDDKTLRLFEVIDNGDIVCLTTSNCPSIAINVVSEILKIVSSYDTIISNLNLNCISWNKDETQIYNSCEDLSYSENSLKVIQENLIKLLETNPLINTEDKTYYVSEYPSTSK